MKSAREIAQALSDLWLMRPLYPQEPFIADIAATIEAEREALHKTELSPRKIQGGSGMKDCKHVDSRS